MALILPNYALVLRAFAVLGNAAPSNTDYSIHLGYIKDFNSTGYIAALNEIFAGASDADLAGLLLKNTGLDKLDLEGDGNTDNTAIATAFVAANSANRVGAILDLVAKFQATTAAAAFNANFESAYAYATNKENVAWRSFDGKIEQVLTVGQDKLVGGAMDDFFKAYLVTGANTLTDGDMLDGGTGNDTLYADINAKQQGFVTTVETKGIENVLFRVQNGQEDTGDNNIATVGIIDAQRFKDVLNWEDNNSRADLVIEDVRINDSQITKDITITMRETDPGNVDYAVYFDQNSLRNTTQNASQMNVRVLDTYAVAQGLDALKDSPYGSFTFYYSLNGGAQTKVTLQSQEMQDAKTLPDMVIAMQKAADEIFKGAVTVSLGATYSVKDSVTSNDVVGNEIIIGAKGSSAITFNTTGAGSGWLATDTVPAVSGLYTSFTTGTTATTDLVTSTVVLDYVGRGSNGGDLVIGGLSVGDTSTSKGVQRFEITVEDDSRLQTVQSTNNTLREVTIKNGTQTRISDAYHKVDTKGGLLSVIGTDLKLDATAAVGATDGLSSNTALPGTTTATGATHNNYGFTDVRLIDGSAMTGKLSFDAVVTEKSIDKYLNKTDPANDPAADNVKFDYNGGSNDDTILVNIDAEVAAKTDTLTGREDFKFTVNGNEGADTLSVGIDFAGNNATLYVNQAQLNNVVINGGAGNDTVNTLTTGDFVVDTGADNDTVYSANTGNKSIWSVGLNGTLGTPTTYVGIAYAGDNTPNAPHDGAPAPTLDPLFLAGGKLTVIYSGPGIAAPTSGGVMGTSATGNNDYSAVTGLGLNGNQLDGLSANKYDNGLEVTVDIPTGANYAVTQYHINQAIKNAINNDAVLKKLLVATDGPGSSLVITSLVDGTHVASDLQISVYRDAAYTSSNTEILNAYKAFSTNSAAVLADVEAAAINTTTVLNLREGMINDATPGAGNNFLAGTDSGAASDSIFDVGAGKDVLVLNTNVTASNETVKFTAGSGIDATVVNFTAAAGTGADLLDFTQYLTSKITAANTNDTTSQDFLDIQLNANNVVDANTVTVLSGLNFTKAKTFANLTADVFKAAINQVAGNTADYGDITGATLNARNNYNAATSSVLVNNSGKAIVLVENDENAGQYKVFEMTFKGQTGTNADGLFDTVTLLGQVDFGNSLTGLSSASLVDHATYHVNAMV